MMQKNTTNDLRATTTREWFYEVRDETLYERFMEGKNYAWLSTHYQLSESGVKQVLARYRRKFNLPNGRQHDAN